MNCENSKTLSNVEQYNDVSNYNDNNDVELISKSDAVITDNEVIILSDSSLTITEKEELNIEDDKNLISFSKNVLNDMTLEEVGRLLISLKSTASGMLYSTCSLINPCAYIHDVNHLKELQQNCSKNNKNERYSNPNQYNLATDCQSPYTQELMKLPSKFVEDM
jgi:hypothetical protein